MWELNTMWFDFEFIITAVHKVLLRQGSDSIELSTGMGWIHLVPLICRFEKENDHSESRENPLNPDLKTLLSSATFFSLLRQMLQSERSTFDIGLLQFQEGPEIR